MKILAVDSSAKSASAAITENDFLISEGYVNIGLTHSETLLPLIDSALKNAGLGYGDIDAYAVTVGPGSFTGIRIGVATVKGLAAANNTTCSGVSTLEAMARVCDYFEGIICCTMDARCNQVYCALFKSSKKDKKRLTEDIAISTEELYNILSSYELPVLLVGDGAELCYSLYCNRECDITLANGLTRNQRAYGAALAALAQNVFKSACEINPVYIRPPQAERELKKKKESN